MTEERTGAGEADGGATETAAATPMRLRLLPAHVVVLSLTACLGVLVAWRGAAGLAPGSDEIPAERRSDSVFAILFNASVGVGLALAWMVELLVTPGRLLRRPGRRRVLGRLLLAALPLAAFGLGHWFANPWLIELAGQVRAALGDLGLG